jgi:hypothetical protein
MKLPISQILLLSLVLASATFAAGKKQPPPPPAPARSPSPAVTDAYVHKEFGDDCSVLPGAPQFVGDFDADGVDDLMLAARCKNPMVDQNEYGFRVIDPYDSFFGFGNVKITAAFNSEDPERKGIVLLVVHGVGPDAWHFAGPKPKFMMINLPFQALTVKKLALRKRTVLGIYMEEEGEGSQTVSVVFWDGHKYRYQPVGADFE